MSYDYGLHEGKRHGPELGDAEDDTLAAIEWQGRHLTSVAGRVDDLRLLRRLSPAPGEELEEDEGWEKMDRVEELVRILKDGVDVGLRPGRVDHNEMRLPQGVCVVIHEYAVVSSGVGR